MIWRKIEGGLTGLPRARKQLVMVSLDALMLLFTMWLSFSLRFEGLFVPWSFNQLVIIGVAPLIAIPIFIRNGLYRAVFRYSGFFVVSAITRAVLLYTLAFGTFVIALSLRDVPRSIAIIQPLMFSWAVIAMRSIGGSVLARRSMLGGPFRARERILIFGAGRSAVQTATALRASRDYHVMGFIDEDPAKIGREIMGLKVYGRPSIAELITRCNIQGVLLALPNITRLQRNRIIDSLRPFSLRVQSIPSVVELASGKVALSDIRDLDIADLLGREPLPQTPDDVCADLAGTVVMVTGAGGSIGSELCRQIVQARPATLLLVEMSEYALYSIHGELAGLCVRGNLDVQLVPLLADVRNFPRMMDLCTRWRPATVYHAAAYKHVPLVEANPVEGVANNVIGTVHAARAAMIGGAGRFVLVSTDKAVRPTNIMGASKRLAEVALQALAAKSAVAFDQDGVLHPNRTVFTMVRFGNVLGSSGSVVPLFRAQLATGGPLTVTDREVTRYFMTIPEAAQLVLQAGAMATGGEVFLLDMGEPIKILDLARKIIELSGATVRDEANPDGDIGIDFVGLRPGEKLYEELLIGDNPQPTWHPRILQARERMWPWEQFRECFAALREALAADDVQRVRIILAEYVDGFGDGCEEEGGSVGALPAGWPRAEPMLVAG